MIDDCKRVSDALEEVLPTYYELFCDSNTEKPCITYREYRNDVDIQSMYIGYSSVGFYIKIWGYDIATIESKAELVDDIMRELGYTRQNSSELVINTQICKVMTYVGYGREDWRI